LKLVFCVFFLLFLTSPLLSQNSKQFCLCLRFQNAASNASSYVQLNIDSKTYSFSVRDTCFRFVTKKKKINVGITATSYIAIENKIDVDSLLQSDCSVIFLKEKVTLLKEVIVRPDNLLKIYGDTLVIRTDSINTKPHSKATDLFEKIPGVSIGSNGSIKVLGKVVEQITVDGKLIFGGDAKATLESLKSDMIKQLEVVNLKQGNTSVNIRLKDDRKQGQYGDIDLGTGYLRIYNFGIRFNKISKGYFLNGFLNFNNINSKVMSEKDESAISKIFIQNGLTGAYSIVQNAENNFLMEESQQMKILPSINITDGIVKSASYGVSFSRSTEKQDWHGYLLGNNASQSLVKESNSLRTIFPIIQNEIGGQTEQRSNIRIWSALSGKINFNPKNNIRISQILSLRNQEQNLVSHQQTQLLGQNQTNISNSIQRNMGNIIQKMYVSQHFLWLKRFDTPAKIFSVYIGHTYDNNESHQLYQNQLISKLRNEQNNNKVTNGGYFQSIKLQSVYSQPISRKFLIEFKTTLSIDNAPFKQFGYKYDTIQKNYNENIPNLSVKSFQIKDIRTQSQSNVLYKTSKITAVFGLGYWSWNSERNVEFKANYSLNQYAILPYLYFEYRSLNHSQISIHYHLSQILPNFNTLLPLPDSSNLLQVTRGNLYLNGVGQQQTEIRYSTVLKGGHNLITSLQYDYLKSPVIAQQIWNSQGILNQTFVNYGDTKRWNSSLIWIQYNRSKSYSLYSSLFASYEKNNLLFVDAPLKIENYFLTLSTSLRWNFSQNTSFHFNLEGSAYGQIIAKSTPNYQNHTTLKYATKLPSNVYLDIKADIFLNRNITISDVNYYPICDIILSKYLSKRDKVRLQFSALNLMNVTRSFEFSSSESYQSSLFTNRLPRLFLLSCTFYLEKWKKSSS
jgi:hypothetical protein